MITFRAILVDDEELARNRLKKLLSQIETIELLAEAENAFKCLELLDRYQPDILFLDIQMPGLNGFELLQQIPENRLPMIIFITAYDQYALKAFDSLAIDYLLKPLKLSDLQKAISKIEALQNKFRQITAHTSEKRGDGNPFSGYTKRFVLKYGNKWQIVEEKNVEMFFAEEKFCYLRSEGKDSMIAFTLQELENKLDPDVFIRVHRSAIVSKKYIKNFKSIGSGRFEIILTDGRKVNSSRYYAQNLKNLLK
ncbi:MAG: response regulator transcription factor [Proteobacteria bacterium]|nr:response regulator transcription factor [Pseudomonadota bacterium]